MLEALGGPRERIRTARAADFELDDIDPLNMVALEIEAAPDARVLPRAPGLPDALFEHDGQLTKREIRAVTLSALAPRRGELLWDIGAGAGSIAIEWLLAIRRSAPSASRACRPCRAHPPQRRGIRRAGPEVVEGRAPDALAGLPAPDAVFIGGGAEPAVARCGVAALRPGGRLVVNAVTLRPRRS